MKEFILIIKGSVEEVTELLTGRSVQVTRWPVLGSTGTDCIARVRTTDKYLTVWITADAHLSPEQWRAGSLLWYGTPLINQV